MGAILKVKNENGEWVHIPAIIGPEGPIGPIGPKGDTGPRGDKGDKGANGEDGIIDVDNTSLITEEGIYKHNGEIVVAHQTDNLTELAVPEEGMRIKNTSGLYFTSIDKCFEGKEVGASFDLIILGFSNSDETFDVSIYDEREDADEDFSYMIEVNGNYADISNSAISGAEVYIPFEENFNLMMRRSLDDLGDVIVLSITETGKEFLRILKQVETGKIATEDDISKVKEELTEEINTVEEKSDLIFANALKGNKSGEIVSMNDVSPIEHELGIKVSGKNHFYFTKSIDVTFVNVLITANKNSAEFTLNGTVSNANACPLSEGLYLEAGQYTISTVGLTGNSGNNRIYFAKSSNTGDILANYIYDGSPKTFTLNEDSNTCLVQLIVDKDFVFDNQTIKIQIEKGSVATTYVPYIPDISAVTVNRVGENTTTYYTPNADGIVDGVTSLYPVTTLTTDTDGVLIDVEYNRDINKAFAEMMQKIILLEGSNA